MSALQHLATWVRHPLRTGAILPSSRRLADALADEAARFDPKIVLEVGTGNGVVASALVRRLPEARVVAMDLADVVPAKADPRVHFLRASAGHAPLRKADVIVSCLPFSSMSPERAEVIVSALHQVSPHLVAFQYSSARMPVLQRAFPDLHVARRILGNVPPARVLTTMV